MAPRKGKPEISLEFKDVSIEIKVCGMDLLPEDREYVKFFPEMDTNLTCRDQIDAFRRFNKKERKKMTKFEYKLVSNHAPAAKEAVVKVLPKLNCEHCGKTFSRRSTLEQHVASHDKHNTSWEEVQDAALKDLEQAIAFNTGIAGKPGVPSVRRESVSPRKELSSSSDNTKSGWSSENEEQEISPPTSYSQLINSSQGSGFNFPNQQNQGQGSSGLKVYKCGRCGIKFRDISVLKKHIITSHAVNKKTGSNGAVKPESCAGGPISCKLCKRKFAARAHLERHMPVHSTLQNKPFECDICGWKFHLQHNMERHKSTHDKGRKAKIPPHLKGTKIKTEESEKDTMELENNAQQPTDSLVKSSDQVEKVNDKLETKETAMIIDKEKAEEEESLNSTEMENKDTEQEVDNGHAEEEVSLGTSECDKTSKNTNKDQNNKESGKMLKEESLLNQKETKDTIKIIEKEESLSSTNLKTKEHCNRKEDSPTSTECQSKERIDEFEDNDISTLNKHEINDLKAKEEHEMEEFPSSTESVKETKASERLLENETVESSTDAASEVEISAKFCDKSDNDEKAVQSSEISSQNDMECEQSQATQEESDESMQIETEQDGGKSCKETLNENTNMETDLNLNISEQPQC